MSNWLGLTDVPLMVSHRRLRMRKKYPRALGEWVCDSGGFTELNLHGKWTVSSDEYIHAIDKYKEEIGNLVWAAPRDWMCEPVVIAKTGLSVPEHQARTVEDFLHLDSERPNTFIPVLQGWERDDYWSHVEQYLAAGVDLRELETVGIGSVCRRSHTQEIADLAAELAGYGLNIHGFGVKRSAFRNAAKHFASADSLAWSFRARRDDPLPGHTHSACQNCLEYALMWRERTLQIIEENR